MIKKLFVILFLCLTLTACAGSFKFEEAKVLSKSVTDRSCRYSNCFNYIVTVEYNGSLYNVDVDSKSHRLVNEGSIVKISYNSLFGRTVMTPLIKQK